MVSVTSTQNAAAQQPPQNTNQTDLQKMIARVAALKQRWMRAILRQVQV